MWITLAGCTLEVSTLICNMKKYICTVVLALSFLIPAKAEKGYGVSLSYFLPTNGYFANPISPLAIRGIGFDVWKGHAGIKTGYVMYHVGGMNIAGNIPVTPSKPVFHSFYSNLIPLYLELDIPISEFGLELNAGGFFYKNFGLKLDESAVLELITADGTFAYSSSTNFNNPWGAGYLIGGKVFYKLSKYKLKAGVNYLVGSSKINLKGTVEKVFFTDTFEYPDAQLDYRGFEIILGISF